MATVRVTQDYAEVVLGEPAARVTRASIEVILGEARMRTTQGSMEALLSGPQSWACKRSS